MVTPTQAGVTIQVRGVGHWFDARQARLSVLEDVTFTAQAGETIALLGPSGCGKSTLLRLVSGLELPRAGRIGVDGVRVTGPDPSRLLAFQDPLLLPWRTVKANVAYGFQARGTPVDWARVSEAITQVGLAEFGDSYPHQLSGGMAQRTSFARVLAQDPRVLLLDEPFGKLDSLTRMTMQNELLTLARNRGFTTLLVTHDVEEALLLATRVIVFSARPARIVQDLPVPMPFPRLRDAGDFVTLRRSLLRALGHGEEFAA